MRAVRLPHLERYLAELPDGWASFPDCVAKATLLQQTQALLPEGLDDAVPERIARRLAEEAPPTAWVPEVEHIAFVLAIADLREHAGRSRESLWAELSEENRKLMARREYRSLLQTGAPERMFRQLEQGWHRFHRGTEFACTEATVASARLELRFPPTLLPELALRMRVASIHGVLAACEVESLDVDYELVQPGLARYHIAWRE